MKEELVAVLYEKPFVCSSRDLDPKIYSLFKSVNYYSKTLIRLLPLYFCRFFRMLGGDFLGCQRRG